MGSNVRSVMEMAKGAADTLESASGAVDVFVLTLVGGKL